MACAFRIFYTVGSLWSSFFSSLTASNICWCQVDEGAVVF